MATAPYQLWIDAAPIASAVRVSSTVTITTSSAHGLQTGAYVQIGDTANLSTSPTPPAAGASMVGVYQVTVTSGTTLTYTSAGTAGTADVSSAFLSYDLLNPLSNYAAGTARQYSANADISTVQLAANGDGSGASMSLDILQEVVPSAGQFLSLVPDQTRVRFAYADTGSVPGTASVLFLGYLASYQSRLNGSGQGVITSVALNDVNTLLDQVGVFGRPGKTSGVVTGGVRNGSTRGPSRSSNVVTLNTYQAHGFSVGQTITVSGVAGGGGTSFNGVFTITAVPTANSLKYAQTGADYSSSATGAIAYTVALDGKSRSSVILSTAGADSANIQTGTTIDIIKGSLVASGFSSNNTTESLIAIGNTTVKTHPGNAVTAISSSSFRLALPAAITGSISGGSFSGSVGVMPPTGIVFDGSNSNGQVSFIIGATTTETAAVQAALARVNAGHSEDYALKRLMSTTDTSLIAGGSAFTPTEAITAPSSSLRSVLDTIIETYQSDARLRRYHITPQGKLSYQLVDSTAVPTYADAPYEMIVTGSGDYNTTTDAATLAAYNLTVTYDHNTIKRAQFNVPAQDSTGEVSTQIEYTDLTKNDGGTATPTAVQLYSQRLNAPIFETVVDFPNSTESLVRAVAAAWFTERHKPLLAGSFELRGAGTATHNQFGFLQGYSARLFTAGGYTAVRTGGSTVTITTTSAHLLSSGNTVVIAGITGAAGTSMNGTAVITVSSTTAFTYTAAGTNGTGTTTGPGGTVVGTGIGYRLVSWAPGQFVEVTAPALSLSGLYRVEQVNLGFEPASYDQVISVSFNRKQPGDLATIIAGQRGT